MAVGCNEDPSGPHPQSVIREQAWCLLPALRGQAAPRLDPRDGKSPGLAATFKAPQSTPGIQQALGISQSLCEH